MLPRHIEIGVVVDTFEMIFQRNNYFFISVCPQPHPCLMKGEKERGRRGGCSRRLMVHTEREHRPNSSSALIYLPLSTDEASNCSHTHMLSQHFSLSWSLLLCRFFASCLAASACTHVSVILCVFFHVFIHTSDDNFFFIHCIPAHV